MIRIYLFVILFSPFSLLAQKEDGIAFQQHLSWREIQERAFATNRYIFVDCYTTWCGPCRKMDAEVYSDKEVGEFMNKNYLCVKVQMDTTAHDDAEKISWYSVARHLMLVGRVKSFPTYLFFSPKGELVHFGVGTAGATDFISLARNAMNPSTQYYTLLRLYRHGKIDSLELLTLLKFTEDLKDDSLAQVIAKTYLNSDVYRKQDNGFTKSDLFIMWRYVDSSNEKGFQFFYNHAKRVDSMMGIQGMSARMIDRVIKSKEIDPWLKKPNISKSEWGRINKRITREYGQEIADRILCSSRSDYYSHLKDWKHFALFFDKEINKYPPIEGGKKYGGTFDDVWQLNFNAWLLFLYCKQGKFLSFGLKWVDTALRINPENLEVYDTKANLLYKMGRKQEGIEEEEKALGRAENEGKRDEYFVKECKGVINKMKSNQPTW